MASLDRDKGRQWTHICRQHPSTNIQNCFGHPGQKGPLGQEKPCSQLCLLHQGARACMHKHSPSCGLLHKGTFMLWCCAVSTRLRRAGMNLVTLSVTVTQPDSAPAIHSCCHFNDAEVILEAVYPLTSSQVASPAAILIAKAISTYPCLWYTHHMFRC